MPLRQFFRFSVSRFGVLAKGLVVSHRRGVEWFETADRHVAQDQIGDVRVSTVFLGIDHSWILEEHVPILFETMVFGGALDQEQRRYATWTEAEEGHREMAEAVMARRHNHETTKGAACEEVEESSSGRSVPHDGAGGTGSPHRRHQGCWSAALDHLVRGHDP
jgi:hypothetical protein